MKYSLIVLYAVIINLISGLVFAYDKNAARKNKRRVPERILHLFEIFGGVFTNVFLMYTINHKNRKFSYWGWTWLIMLGWIAILILILLKK